MFRPLTLLTLLTFLPACDFVKSEPDPTPGDELASDAGCDEVAVVLGGIDEESPLGFSAAELLGVVAGSHTSPMEWGAGLTEGPIQVAFGPESGAGSLTVGVKYAGGEVRHITSKPKSGEEGGPAGLCNDRIEVDVAVTVESAGGAFAESFTAPLRATTRGIGEIRREIAVDDLKGSFEVTKLEPADAEVAPISFEIGISGAGLFGRASSTVSMSDGAVAVAGALQVARWPAADSACDYGEALVAAGDAVAGFSAEDALALLAAPSAFELTWQGEAPTAMTLAVTPGEAVCAAIEGDSIGALRIPADAAVTTADGRWSGSFAVEVWAQPAADGTLAAVRVQSFAPYASTVPAGEFEATFGLKEVDLAGFDEAALDFSGEFVPSGEGASATGQVTVLGVNLPMCSDEPGAPCEGNDYVEIENATWASQ